MLRLASVKWLRAILTLLICVTIVFFVLRISGDPAQALLPDDTPAEILAEYRRRWGLDLPLWEQYLRYLAAVVRGDFGISFADGRPAWEVVMEKIPNTLLLGGLSLAVAIASGLVAGVTAARHHGRRLDRFVMGFAVLGYSLPNFFLAIMLILVFALQMRLLPSAGSQTWAHLVMPVLTLSAATAGKVARFTRTSMLEVLGLPFVRAVRGKGVPPVAVLMRHAIPNAAIPIVTMLGFELGLVIGGAVVTETVFAWPGVGRLLVVSVGQRDLAVVQTIILLIAATMVASNLLVDIAYGWLDPRVNASRVQKEA